MSEEKEPTLAEIMEATGKIQLIPPYKQLETVTPQEFVELKSPLKEVPLDEVSLLLKWFNGLNDYFSGPKHNTNKENQ